MKKRVFLALVLACVIMGGAFAQQRAPAATALKNAFSMDIFQVIGAFVPTDEHFFGIALPASYERLIVPHFSMGGDLDLYFGFGFGSGKLTTDVYLGLLAEARVYPATENLSGFFFGTTLGFDMLFKDGNISSNKGGWFGLAASIKTGYKYIFSNRLFLEPSLTYVFSKAGGGLDVSGMPGGFKGGLRFGSAF